MRPLTFALALMFAACDDTPMERPAEDSSSTPTTPDGSTPTIPGTTSDTETTGGGTASSEFADILPGEAYDGLPEELELDIGGLPFYVRTYGDGPNVVVVINGGPGQSHHYCQSADVLATTEVKVVTFDQRGTGLTPHPQNANYAIDRYAKDVEELRVALGAEQIHLIGHSFGGAYAMAYTADFNNRVASLQLFSSSTVRQIDVDTTEFEARILEYEQDGTFPPGYNELDGDNNCAPYFQTIWPVYLYDENFPMTQGLLDTTCDLETFFGTFDSNMFGWDLSRGVGNYTGPVNLYYGEADPFMEESKSIPKYFDSTTVDEIVLPECGHYWEECADDFFARAAAFLAENM